MTLRDSKLGKYSSNFIKLTQHQVKLVKAAKYKLSKISNGGGSEGVVRVPENQKVFPDTKYGIWR